MAFNLSGILPTVTLTIFDLPLLLTGCSRFSNSPLLGGLSKDAVSNRINELQKYNICKEYASNDQLVAVEQLIIDAITLNENKLQLSKHFACFVNKGYFTFWAPRLSAMMRTDEMSMALLVMFDQTNNYKQAIEQLTPYWSSHALQECFNKLVYCGVLVESVSAKPKKYWDLIRGQNTVKKKSASWEQLIPDHRIPVYFVPHMQNHYPLALGVLYSALQNHDEGSLLENFQLIPITYMTPTDFINGPYKKFRAGVWLFSNYMWSIDVNMQISEAIKKHDSNNITIHGGPSTPEYPQANRAFMDQYQSVDISVHGEGEVAIVELFESIAKKDHQIIIQTSIQQVSGITYREFNNSQLIRTVKRKRTATPDIVPSPYLSGYFDAYGANVEAAIIESNRGCPFGCTFCDWGSATNQKVRKFELGRVKQEIDWIAKHQVRVLWIADANYGLYDRDIELAQYIVDVKNKTGYPQEVVVNYTKNSTWRLVEIIKIFTAGGIISQGIISIQTTDEQTLEVINRKNIKTEKYDELTKVFHDLKLPLSTDLMIGLPGSTVESFNKDLQRYIDMDISVKAYPTQLLPNSPMADPAYIEKYQIKADDNDFLISTYSYTENELQWMKGIYHIYTVADGYGLLRYVIRYLQWEYDITAINFLNDLLRYTNNNPEKYDKITWAVRYFVSDKCMPGGWHQFYQQVSDYVLERYEIASDSGFEVVYQVSAMSMPDDGIEYPVTIRLNHDFSAYFVNKLQKNGQSSYPLTHYPAARFMISDPNNMSSIDMDYMQYDSHQYFYELHSDTARPKSTSEYV